MATVVRITDPALLNYHIQCEVVYAETKKRIDEELPLLEGSIYGIEEFSTEVRAKGKVYQGATDTVELTQRMVKEQKDFLSEYEDFKSTHEKTILLISNIKRTIDFLTPVPRQWSAEKTFEANTPKLYAQTKESERICLGHIATLIPLQTQVINLNDRLCTLINDKTTTWSLQRFCSIVANDGKPLSFAARTLNYIAPYFVTPTFTRADDIKMLEPPVSEAALETPKPPTEKSPQPEQSLPPLDASKEAGEFSELFGSSVVDEDGLF